MQAIEEEGFPTVALAAVDAQRPRRSRVLSQRDVRVDCLKAFETTFELTSADGAGAPQYVRLVVLRSPFEWPIRGERFRTLLVFGFASTRAHFAAQVQELERFVNQVDIDHDDALRERTAQVLDCTEPRRDVADVELEVSARGEITSIEPRAPWLGAARPSLANGCAYCPTAASRSSSSAATTTERRT